MRVKHLRGLWAVPLLAIASFGAGATDLRLVEAARNQNRDAVRTLLKQGADVNAPQPDGATALHWAIHWDDQDTADLLIRAGANVNAKNDLDATPLWVASAQGSAAMVERLLKAGANPNVTLIEGETPLMAASRTGSVEAVKLLLARGADVNAKERSRGQTALMWAVTQHHPEVVQALIELRADIQARSNVRRRLVNTGGQGGGGVDDRYNPPGVLEEDQGGFTPLLFAAQQGSVDSARLLLAAGANVNDAAPNGASALVVATHSGHGAFAAFLLDKGADPNAAGAGYTALHAAELRGDLDLVKALLARGADPNASITKGSPVRRASTDWAVSQSWIGGTPFWLAAKFVDVGMMRVLAAGGANPQFAMKDGTTPLMAAIGTGAGGGGGGGGDRRARGVGLIGPDSDDELNALEAVKLVVELGTDVNATDAVGNTAVHSAVTKRYNTIIQFLADKGAKLDVKNKKGQTPLAMTAPPRGTANVVDLYAPNVDSKSTADLLRKLGATE